jgi:magnesium transporter
MPTETETDPEVTEDGTVLSEEFVDRVLAAVDAEDSAGVKALLDPLHAADIADLLEQISASNRTALIGLWGREIDGEVLSELDESIRESVIASLPRNVLGRAVRGLDSDDVVDLIEDLEEDQQSRILKSLKAEYRAGIESALAYPEYSAGRMMQRELVEMPEHWTVGEAIDHLRSAETLPDQFYHVILVNPEREPVGYVALGRVLSSPRVMALTEILEPSFRPVSVLDPESDVAYLFNQYHLITAPVIDEQRKLVGVVTIDDAMIVLDEDHEAEMLRLAGVDEDASLSDSVYRTSRGRAVWLFVNLLTAILASVVISVYADTIDQMIALAVLMPIVASMGGNAGTQTMTVAVRSIATRDLTARNAVRVCWREIAVGGINGVLFGVLMAGVAGLWFGVPMLAAVIALAMLLTLVAAALGGILIPLVLDRFGIDPALASGPFVTTITDVVGFFAFLGLATAILL